MNVRLTALAIVTLALLVAHSANAVPMNESAPSGLWENVLVTSGDRKPAAKMGFGQPGPVGVMSATTDISGAHNRLELYAGSKGFTVNRTGAVYDLEGGAVFKLREGVSVTGSYRGLGYDFLATGSEITEPQFSGTFFGLKLDF